MSVLAGAKVFADSRGKSLQTLEVITIQTLKPLRRFSHDDQNADEPIGINKNQAKNLKGKGLN